MEPKFEDATIELKGVYDDGTTHNHCGIILISRWPFVRRVTINIERIEVYEKPCIFCGKTYKELYSES